MILNVNILRNHKVLSKGREQAAELLESVLKVFDIPQPSYSYKEKKDTALTEAISVLSASSNKKQAKNIKTVYDTKNKFYLCEVSARIPTPLYQIKLLREQRQKQKLLLKQNHNNGVNGKANSSSGTNNGIQQLSPINGSAIGNTSSKSTMIQTKVGQHVTVPITFPTPTKSKKGELYNIYGAGESDTRNSARNLAALEVIYQMEQILNVPRGELPNHIQKNAEQLLQLTEAHHTIPYDEAIPGITWHNIPTDRSEERRVGKEC